MDKENISRNSQIKEEKASRRKLLSAIGITGVAAMSSNLIPGITSSVSAAKNKDKQEPITDDADRISYTFQKGLKQRTVANKLREMVSVKDFGAVGDGKTDDTVAIQNAIQYVLEQGKSEIFIPGGEYKITKTSKKAKEVTFIGDGVTFSDGDYNVISLSDHQERLDELTDKVGTQKDVNLSQASEVYLYDLELEAVTVNQALAIDEVENDIYATQVTKVDGDDVESFTITRSSLGGKKKSSMLIRHGGHGTSIGIERDGNKIYVWTNMIKVTKDGKKGKQYLCRFPYEADEEIIIDDSRVEKILEFPDPKRYMTPFSDVKNDLLAIRHTDKTGTPKTRIDVHNMDDLKKGTNKVLYSYDFTDLMNASVLQGLALDKDIFYVTFGQQAEDFHLFKVQMKTSEIEAEIKRPVGHNEEGEYNFGFGEPQGLYLYTDPETNYKTLITVLTMDLAGRRRQKLFAFSSNIGIQKFMGLASERAQNIKLTRDDGKGIRLKDISSISAIRTPGFYYMTTVEGDEMDDHPRKGVAGWWLNVTPTDASGKAVFQELIRNSSVSPERFTRVVSPSDPPTSWKLIIEQEMTEAQTPELEGDLVSEGEEAVTYETNALKQLIITGTIKHKESLSDSMKLFKLPKDYRPEKKHTILARTSNGIADLVIDTNGEVAIDKIIVGKEPTSISLQIITTL